MKNQSPFLGGGVLYCAVCNEKLPEISIAHGDPYCSRECAQLAFGVRPRESKNSEPWKKPPRPGRNTPKENILVAKLRSLGFSADTSTAPFVATCHKCGVEVIGGEKDVVLRAIEQIRSCGCRPTARDTGRRKRK